MKSNKSFVAKPGRVSRQWQTVDLKDQVLGRAATQIASILRGKTKATYTPHTDTGDFVIAVNASQIRLTGNKLNDKMYHRHSEYIGGMKSEKAGILLKRKPEELIYLAVKGMIPNTPLGRKMLKKLRVFSGDAHPHQAQQANQQPLTPNS